MMWITVPPVLFLQRPTVCEMWELCMIFFSSREMTWNVLTGLKEGATGLWRHLYQGSIIRQKS